MQLAAARTASGEAGRLDLAPEATPAPELKRDLGDRAELSTCAVLQFDDGQMVIPCDGNCFTSDNNYGCEEYFYTTCYDAFDPICEQGSDACCITDEGYAYCATIFKEVDDKTYTQFECFSELRGEYTAMSGSVTVTSEISAESGYILLQGEDPIPAPYATASGEPDFTSTDSNSEPTGANDSGEDNGGSPPAGAIAGGVIGGVALVGLIAFGWWWFRRRNSRKAAQEKATVEAVALHDRDAQLKGHYGPISHYPESDVHYDNLQMNAPSTAGSVTYYHPSTTTSPAAPSEVTPSAISPIAYVEAPGDRPPKPAVELDSRPRDR